MEVEKSKGSSEDIMICACSSVEHQIVVRIDEDDKNMAYCEIHLCKLPFFKRLKNGLKYIFGYKSKYGDFDEFILDWRHADKLIELGKKLKDEQ